MVKYPSRRWFLGVGAILLLVCVLASLALGQATMRRTPRLQVRAIQTGLVIPGMEELRITLPPTRAEALRTKQAANVQVLARSYFMRNNIPHLRLAGDREVMLMRLTTMEGQPTRRQLSASMKLPTAMRAYRLHLNLTVVGKLRPLLPPDTLDHRSNQTPIRDQQNRGTCVAFASMAGLEVAYGSTTLDLSEQDAYHIYMRQEGRTCCYNYGLKTTNSADYLKNHAVCKETNWGYVNYGGLGCPISNPNGHRPDAAEDNARHKIKTCQMIWRNDELTTDSGTYINNPKYLESILHSGKDIIFGTHVAGWSGSLAGVIDVQLGPGGQPLPSAGGHAMLVVGYDRPAEYFIVKNSWGTGYGQSGYLYLSYDYIRTYAKYGYYVTGVEPVLTTFRPMLRRGVLRRRP